MRRRRRAIRREPGADFALVIEADVYDPLLLNFRGVADLCCTLPGV